MGVGIIDGARYILAIALHGRRGVGRAGCAELAALEQIFRLRKLKRSKLMAVFLFVRRRVARRPNSGLCRRNRPLLSAFP